MVVVTKSRAGLMQSQDFKRGQSVGRSLCIEMVKCPRCGSKRGMPCTGAAGGTRKSNHAERVIAVGRLANLPKHTTDDIKCHGRVSRREIEEGRTPRGAFTRETLAKWGVPWPPPSGWIEHITKGENQ